MKKIVYYAHHQWKYNTPIEQWELSLIEKKLSEYEVFNPSTQFIFSPYMTEDEIMVECLEKVKECDALVFSSLSGVVGRGVFSEIQKAFEKQIPVFRIVADKILAVNSISFEFCEHRTNRTYAKIEDIEEWRIL